MAAMSEAEIEPGFHAVVPPEAEAGYDYAEYWGVNETSGLHGDLHPLPEQRLNFSNPDGNNKHDGNSRADIDISLF